MARGNQNQGDGQTPKTKQCYVCNKQTSGDKRCDDCGNLRVVECPHAACGAKGIPNTAKCGQCGGDLSSKKIGGGTIKPPTKADQQWDLEVTPAVVAGKGSIRIQVTRGKAGVKAAVWVGVKSGGVKCYSDKTIVGGSFAPAAGVKENQKFSTDKDGFLFLTVAFDGQDQVQITVAIVGCQADLKRPVNLKGPKFKPVLTSIFYSRRIREAMDQIRLGLEYKNRR